VKIALLKSGLFFCQSDDPEIVKKAKESVFDALRVSTLPDLYQMNDIDKVNVLELMKKFNEMFQENLGQDTTAIKM